MGKDYGCMGKHLVSSSSIYTYSVNLCNPLSVNLDMLIIFNLLHILIIDNLKLLLLSQVILFGIF